MVLSAGLLPAVLPGKIRLLPSHGESPLSRCSLPLCWPLLLRLYSHKEPASACVAVGAQGAGVSSKPDGCSEAGLTWWKDMAYPCAPQGPEPSINSSLDGFCSGLL